MEVKDTTFKKKIRSVFLTPGYIFKNRPKLVKYIPIKFKCSKCTKEQ